MLSLSLRSRENSIISFSSKSSISLAFIPVVFAFYFDEFVVTQTLIPASLIYSKTSFTSFYMHSSTAVIPKNSKFSSNFWKILILKSGCFSNFLLSYLNKLYWSLSNFLIAKIVVWRPNSSYLRIKKHSFMQSIIRQYWLKLKDPDPIASIPHFISNKQSDFILLSFHQRKPKSFSR